MRLSLLVALLGVGITEGTAKHMSGSTYRCDVQGGERGVCILGPGNYTDSTCDGKCGTPFAGCVSDWDCSLAGVCDVSTKACKCDPWASGSDCSYLNFQPVDPLALGYLDESESSWGGNAVLGSDNKWHLYMAGRLTIEGPLTCV